MRQERRASGVGRAPFPVLCHDDYVIERTKTTTRPGKPNQPQPPTGRPTSGRVIRIHAGQSHGFIRDADSREVFFHRSDTTFGTFNKLTVGDKVAFDLIEDRVSGPRAIAVRLGNRARS
jgi:cold shock CspA family protein